MAAPSTTMFGLSDGEAKIAMCALKLFVTDGKVEKSELATLTGHANPDSALRVWYMVKKKIMDANMSPSAGSPASRVDLNTPTKGPKKTPSKMRSQTPKKRSKKKAEEEEDDPEVDEQPPKRVKREAANVTDIFQSDAEGDS